jgi:hypothetical protein
MTSCKCGCLIVKNSIVKDKCDRCYLKSIRTDTLPEEDKLAKYSKYKQGEW